MKDITRIFKKHGLKISIKTNLKVVNFLHVTFNLTDGTYYQYRKPNDEPLYININSNLPQSILDHIPAAIHRRLTEISCNEETFNKAKSCYEEALKSRPQDLKIAR